MFYSSSCWLIWICSAHRLHPHPCCPLFLLPLVRVAHAARVDMSNPGHRSPLPLPVTTVARELIRSSARLLAWLAAAIASTLAGDYIHKAIGDTTTQVDNSVNLTDFSGYSHGQFGNRSAEFVKRAVALNKPFFAYIGTTGTRALTSFWTISTV